MPAANPINSLPVSFECSIQIKIPFSISSENILYCFVVLVTKDNFSEEIGLQASAVGEDCLIMVKDNLNFLYFLTLSSSQYRFFKQIYLINCKNQTNGLYTECGQNEFIEIEPKIMEYNDNNSEVEVIGTSSSSNAEEIIAKSFDNKLSDNISTVIIWIIVICSIVTALIVSIIELRCLYLRCQASKGTQD
jgi:ABC-type antimicrobial peptide transport system permease subunit